MRGPETFAAGRSALGQVRIEGKPDIQEIHVAGDYAFCWKQTILSFRKERDGRWILLRDANMRLTMLDQRAVGQVRPEAESPSEKAYECMVSQEGLSVRGGFKRQPHVKLCAIGTRAEVDFSVMTFDDDSMADHQAESRA